MSAEVLPGSAGPFTRAITYSWDTNRRYSPIVVQVQTLGLTTPAPDDWVPWIIYDLGLEDVIPYIRDFRRVLTEGPAWQARRGTPDGISIGIGWVDSAGVVAPPDGRHNWWEFQVAFTETVTSLEQLRQLYGVINLSKAAEDVLFRVYSPDYDLRPVRMDEHRFDDGLMDDYSGAPRWEGGPYVSFGVDESGVTPLDQIPTGNTMIEETRVTDWFEGLRLDESTADDDRPRQIVFGDTEVDGTSLTTTHGDTHGEVWQDVPWDEVGGPQVFIARTTTSSATVESRYDGEDTWQGAYQPTDRPWTEAGGSVPVPTPAETS